MPIQIVKPPHGLDEICARFGDVAAYVRPNGTLSTKWQREHLTTIALPFPIPLAWDRSVTVRRICCHRLLAHLFVSLFDEVERAGLTSSIQDFGGCFCFRTMRNGSQLSTHAWGIAIDLNVATNQLGTKGDMAPRLVTLFSGYGFEWGGVWKESCRDPMHFQYCSGY
ncbi:MAG: M15 family metallopeptidase [Chitinivibrionia bacterium]|nr:M15 family metallopeptidase [Chitinivibrionia bacterium]